MENKEKILIVDDNMKNIQVLGNLLKEQEYEIAIATNGQSALNFLENMIPDLILLDVMMPGMSGYEVCREMRRTEGLIEVPVIFLTAKSESKDILEGFNSGGMDYISKPFQSAELLARVRTHLELQRTKKELKKTISQLKEANDKLSISSNTDPLTKLWNRRYVMERLKEENSRAHRSSHSFAIILCDIDHFKKVNDTFGHNGGDRTLEEFAKLLIGNSRLEDIMARWGGEEFLILLPSTDSEGALNMGEKIRHLIEMMIIPYKGTEIKITASFGITTSLGEEDLNQIINRADQALYKSKELGRNRVTTISV